MNDKRLLFLQSKVLSGKLVCSTVVIETFYSITKADVCVMMSAIVEWQFMMQWCLSDCDFAVGEEIRKYHLVHFWGTLFLHFWGQTGDPLAIFGQVQTQLLISPFNLSCLKSHHHYNFQLITSPQLPQKSAFKLLFLGIYNSIWLTLMSDETS